MSNVQFSDSDISKRLDDILRQDKGSALEEQSALFHELRNYNNGIGGLANLLFTSYDLEKKTGMQIAYICETINRLTGNIQSLSQSVKARIDLGDDASSCIDIQKIDEAIKEDTKMFVANAKNLECRGDILGMIDGNADGRAAELIRMLDSHIDKTIYCYNLQFSEKFHRTGYYPASDIKAYAKANSYNDGKILAKVSLSHLADCHMLGKNNDILKNAVIPLHINVNRHAFNPDNDIYDRLKRNDFSKEVIIESAADETSSLIRYSVIDNGFGVSGKVKKNLLKERGVTSKDNPDDTGEGLWGIKRFVESLGGRIWYDTQPGLWTHFHFTIPYDSKENELYITGSRATKLVI